MKLYKKLSDVIDSLDNVCDAIAECDKCPFGKWNDKTFDCKICNLQNEVRKLRTSIRLEKKEDA